MESVHGGRRAGRSPNTAKYLRRFHNLEEIGRVNPLLRYSPILAPSSQLPESDRKIRKPKYANLDEEIQSSRLPLATPRLMAMIPNDIPKAHRHFPFTQG